MPDRFITMDEVLDRVPYSKTHIYRKIAAGTFPRPVPLSQFRVAFLEREIEEWIAARLDARDRAEGEDTRRERAKAAAGGAS